MSLNAIMSSAASGLLASQRGMRATSDNISNVNTPGYARQELQLSSRVIGGIMNGVDVDAVARVTDQYLVRATYEAAAREQNAQVRAELLDRAQAAYGDPSAGASVFDALNDVSAALTSVATEPGSMVRRANAVADIQSLFDDYDRVSAELASLREEADARVVAGVGEVNALLDDVVRLNGDIQRGQLNGDASGAENAMAQTLDQLAQYLDIRVAQRPSGTYEVRTDTGLLLASEQAAVLSYNGGGTSGPDRVYPPVTVQFAEAPPQTLDDNLASGQLAGLISLRDRELPELSEQLGALAAETIDALNRTHNDGVAFPPPTALTGRATGLAGADSIGFTGQTSLVMMDAAGTWQGRVDLDFDAGTVSVDGGATYAMGGDLDSMTVALNNALNDVDPGAGATFANGQLNLSGGALGLGFTQDPAVPGADASRGGRGFSHFFGLNDIARPQTAAFFETGLAGTDAHGFGAANPIDIEITNAAGATISAQSVTFPAGGDIDSAIAALNTAFTGQATFALDANGALSVTTTDPSARLQVVGDQTARTDTGISFSGLFGLGHAPRADVARGIQIDDAVAANPQRLALGAVDVDGRLVGDVVTGSGDGSNADPFSLSLSTPTTIDAAGAISASTTTVLDYAGRVAGDAGRRATTADRALDSAIALRGEADSRRASVEGVNIDEELIKLTQFQQSYNASSRLIQAANEMTDTLLSLI